MTNIILMLRYKKRNKFHCVQAAKVVKSKDVHCVKSVRIRSYSGPYFPAFGLNTDQYNSEYGHFLRSSCYRIKFCPQWLIFTHFSNSNFLVIKKPLKIKSEYQLAYSWFIFNIFNSFGLIDIVLVLFPLCYFGHIFLSQKNLVLLSLTTICCNFSYKNLH